MISIDQLDREISDAAFMAGHVRSGKQASFWRRACKRAIRAKIVMIQMESSE